MITDQMKFIKGVTECVQSVVPKLESYRMKNVNKYHKEEELEYSEYSKMEKYKNRVRLVDCVLPGLKLFLAAMTDDGFTPDQESKIDID